MLKIRKVRTKMYGTRQDTWYFVLVFKVVTLKILLGKEKVQLDEDFLVIIQPMYSHIRTACITPSYPGALNMIWESKE